MAFVFTADNHLSPLIWLNRESIVDDAYKAFVQIIDYAVRFTVPVILGGDVIDKRRPDPKTVDFICHQMDRCRDAGVPVFYIQGQHELDRTTPWLSVHPWPTHVHKKTFFIGELEFYALDWLPREELLVELAAIPPSTDVLVCHQVWHEHMGNIGQQDGSFTEVPHVKSVLTGDYHVTDVKNYIGQTGQQLTVYSPGATRLCALDQPPQKTFFVLTPLPDRRLNHEHVRLSTRMLEKRLVFSPMDLDNLCATLLQWRQSGGRASGPWPYDETLKPIVQVVFRDDVPDVMARVTAAAEGAFELFFDPQPVVDNVLVDVSQLQLGTITLNQAIETISPHPALTLAAQQVLGSPDPYGEWDRQYKQARAEFEKSLTNVNTV